MGILGVWRDMEIKGLNQHVFIDHAKLYEVALHHAKDDFQIPNWRFDGVYAKHAWAYVANEIFVNCFNAHYNVFAKPDTKYTVANPGDPARPFTGAFAMQRTFYGNFGERIIQAHDFAKHVKSPRAMAKFFGGIVPIPSPELKQECGKDFVVNLEKKFDGNPLNLIEEAMTGEFRGQKAIRAFNNGKGLAELLINEFPIAYGADIQELNGQKLVFNKRAQLVAVLLHGRALDSNGILPVVEDIDEVGPIADYELPKALRAMGIFRYSEELAEKVDNWKEISKDRQMEIEIRVATVVACCELLEKLNSLRAELFEKNYLLNICNLDFWLWKMGKDAKHLRPHLTRTSAY